MNGEMQLFSSPSKNNSSGCRISWLQKQSWMQIFIDSVEIIYELVRRLVMVNETSLLFPIKQFFKQKSGMGEM